jgi:Transglycosylase SLT domain
VSAYLPAPDADRGHFDSASDVSSFEATAVVSTAAVSPVSYASSRRSSHRRTPVKPVVSGHTVVSATAALGAVVTGGFMAIDPTPTSFTANAADAVGPTPTTADLAATTQPLHVQPVSEGHQLSQLESVTSAAERLPVAVPGDRVSSIDQRDIDALHKGERLAAEAVAAHAAAMKEAKILAGGGDLDDWIAVALNKLNLDQSLAKGLKKIIMAESHGNPKAINRTDSNALAGRPSQGLMQVIPSTFRHYVLPELAHRGITDPVANITAGVRYMMTNYGIATLRAGGRTSASGHYIGY